jgi:hypothetical protein
LQPSHSFWDGLWKREEHFYESARPDLRHNIPFVAVSSIASQFYCEYKIENEFAVGEIPTEAKETGTSLHDELMPTVAITRSEFAKMVSRKKPSLGVLRVWGAAQGIRLVGMPDHIVWAEGRPLWLVELKTTRGDPSPLWEDQENQVRIYGLLLELMGFDCSKMQLAVVRLRTNELDEAEKREWIVKVSDSLLANKINELEEKYEGTMKAHLLKHDRGLAEAAIALKAGYWLNQREPTSSTSVGKCRACEYRSVCEKSLFKEA